MRREHPYGVELRPPHLLLPTNSLAVPLEELEISSHRYAIANGVGSTIDLVSIDLHRRALVGRGESWWWNDDDFVVLGDAYEA